MCPPFRQVHTGQPHLGTGFSICSIFKGFLSLARIFFSAALGLVLGGKRPQPNLKPVYISRVSLHKRGLPPLFQPGQHLGRVPVIPIIAHQNPVMFFHLWGRGNRNFWRRGARLLEGSDGWGDPGLMGGAAGCPSRAGCFGSGGAGGGSTAGFEVATEPGPAVGGPAR